MFETIVQKKNEAGVPDCLKRTSRAFPFFLMNNARVRYNSDLLASVQILIYTQETDFPAAPSNAVHRCSLHAYIGAEQAGLAAPEEALQKETPKM